MTEEEYQEQQIDKQMQNITNSQKIIDIIKQNGMKAGVAINPHTSPYVLTDVLINIDLVCIMSVNPGFGWQSFIENTYRKLEVLTRLKKESDRASVILYLNENSDNPKPLP